jgi:hypothetical protein
MNLNYLYKTLKRKEGVSLHNDETSTGIPRDKKRSD